MTHSIFVLLEKGYESSFEHLALRQLCAAYKLKLITIPHDYATVQEGLDNTGGKKAFLFRPGRVERSKEFKDYQPNEDTVFCFGSPQNNLVSYLKEGDEALHITTGREVDMMALSVASMVAYVHGQQV